MKIIIVEIVRSSINGSGYEKAIECLKALREACVDENECQVFNRFLRKLKQNVHNMPNFRDFWLFIIQHDV